MSLEMRFNRSVDRLWNWFRWQSRLMQGRARPDAPTGFHPWMATGALVLVALAYQVVSGGLLLLYYQPSTYPTLTLCGQTTGSLSAAPAAWCSTYYLMHSVPMGAVLLTSHLYGAYVVIFLLLVHLFRGFFVGNYKQPGGRSSWMAGTLLLLLTLGMGFTGYLLTYTQLSYNATQVSITLVQALPVVGSPIANLVMGDGTPQSLLSRMFAFHVILLPVAIAVLVFFHKRNVLFPRVLVPLVKWGLLYVGTLLGVASVWLWSLPTYAGSSGGAQAVTVPAWYFLWVFKLVDFDGVTPEAAMLFTTVLVLVFLLLPFLDRSGSMHPRDRPVFVFLGSSLLGFFVLMTAWGDLAPGVPISPEEAAARLGPIVVANALAVGFFYVRYRRSAANVGPSKATPTIPVEVSPTAPGPHARGTVTPSVLSLAGLVGALFLLTFGLVLPSLFLLAAFLVQLAEVARPSVAVARAGTHGGSAPWVFPVVGLASVGALWLALVLAVAL
jgi:quinol-cytochrome oxidoreductase complex cytochrome b subunit